MSHVDEGTLHELVDGALAPSARASVEAHLATCGDCARRFAEATAMARQVHELLGTLDEVPASVTVVPAAAAVAAARAAERVVPPPAVSVGPSRTLRRLAIAASLLMVAGVSYVAGTRGRDGADRPAAARFDAVAVATADSAVPAPAMAEAPAARAGNAVAPMEGGVPPVVGGRRRMVAKSTTDRRAEVAVQDQAPGSPSLAAPMAPPPARPPEPVVAASEPPAPVPAGASQSVAPLVAAPRAAAPMAAGAEAAVRMRPAVTPLPGYTVTENVSVPPSIRRRYESPAGTAVLLVIVPLEAAQEVPAARKAAPAGAEFTVRTVGGTTSVRWTARGAQYELTSVLPPDSLVKLATQLR